MPSWRQKGCPLESQLWLGVRSELCVDSEISPNLGGIFVGNSKDKMVFQGLFWFLVENTGYSCSLCDDHEVIDWRFDCLSLGIWCPRLSTRLAKRVKTFTLSIKAIKWNVEWIRLSGCSWTNRRYSVLKELLEMEAISSTRDMLASSHAHLDLNVPRL